MFKFLLTLLLINQIAGDAITFQEFGGKVPTDDRFDLFFKYTNDGARSCEIALKKPSENYKQYAFIKIDCSNAGGKGVTLNYNPNPVAGSGYVIEFKVFNGATQTLYYSVPVTVENGKQGFHTYQGKLYDANKNIFTIRGVNNPHGDWDFQASQPAKNALKSIVDVTKANTVRMLWYAFKNGLTATLLDSIIQEARNQKLIAVVELHDATGSTNPADLQKLAEWWANNVWLLIKHKKYLIPNIANEWSKHGELISRWRDEYTKAIKTIRNAGYSGTLLVDAAAYAQNADCITTHGAEVYANDPVKNVMFSIHMYADWAFRSNSTKLFGTNFYVSTELKKIKDRNLPFMVGEFANKHNANDWDDKSKLHIIAEIDAPLIMKECVTHGFGYIAWSWCQNGVVDVQNGVQTNGNPVSMKHDLQYLDMVNGKKWQATAADLSTWGRIAVDDPNGIKATSVKASVYP